MIKIMATANKLLQDAQPKGRCSSRSPAREKLCNFEDFELINVLNYLDHPRQVWCVFASRH